jgi:hypothetical protein
MLLFNNPHQNVRSVPKCLAALHVVQCPCLELPYSIEAPLLDKQLAVAAGTNSSCHPWKEVRQKCRMPQRRKTSKAADVCRRGVHSGLCLECQMFETDKSNCQSHSPGRSSPQKDRPHQHQGLQSLCKAHFLPNASRPQAERPLCAHLIVRILWLRRGLGQGVSSKKPACAPLLPEVDPEMFPRRKLQRCNRPIMS